MLSSYLAVKKGLYASLVYAFFSFHAGEKRDIKPNFGPKYLDLYLCQNKWSHFGRILFHCLCPILDLCFPAICVTHPTTFHM